MADWWTWARNLFQPSRAGIERVQAEVDAIKPDIARLKEQVAALEAFRDLAKDARQ